jgi:hypothetical protein
VLQLSLSDGEFKSTRVLDIVQELNVRGHRVKEQNRLHKLSPVRVRFDGRFFKLLECSPQPYLSQ